MLDALQNVLVYGGAFVLVLSLVVFVHEFGHFQAARWSGVAVDTFSIGFGKTLASWKDKQGVQWKIGALPLGGYVKFADDADASSARPLDAELTEEERAAARAKGFFHVQPLRIKAFVVAAGPLTNFLFSILIFAAVILAIGRDATDLGALPARVDTVVAGQPAAAAGFQPGDVVRSIDGQSITRFGELQEAIAGKPGQAITFSVVRGDSLLTLTATPGSREQLTSTGERVTRGMLGIGITIRPEERRTERLNPIQAVGFGAEQTWKIIADTIGYIGNIFTGKASAEHLAGPLGILDQSGKVAEGSWRAGGEDGLGGQFAALALSLLQWAAFLSVAVGFANLLPIPVLDGGHLVFYAYEAVRGKPPSARAMEWSFRAGLAVLLSLFVLATWNDLQRLNVLEFLSGMLS
jgi:regulator of sigma E protease